MTWGVYGVKGGFFIKNEFNVFRYWWESVGREREVENIEGRMDIVSFWDVDLELGWRVRIRK